MDDRAHRFIIFWAEWMLILAQKKEGDNIVQAEATNEMKQLAIFLVCLAIFGIIVALILYFGLSLPAQAAGAAPCNC